MPSAEILATTAALFVKATILAARWAATVRRRAMTSIVSMSADEKDKEIACLRERVDQLQMQVQINPYGFCGLPSPSPMRSVDVSSRISYNNVDLELGMATPSTQVSAMISPETKERLERYARAHGLKKGYLIETALLHHISALESLPADVVIPPRLVVSRQTGKALLERIEKPGKPTAAMKELFDDEAGE